MYLDGDILLWFTAENFCAADVDVRVQWRHGEDGALFPTIRLEELV